MVYILVSIAIIIDAIAAGLALSGLLKGGQARALIAAVVSVQVVSFVTFYVSYILPGSGIVSEFPYYLLPGLFGALLALLFYYDDITKAVPLAYAAGALGTLIGADIARVPLLFRELGPFAGSMGGAGAMDLVFLSGMISISVAFLFARKKDLAASREKSWIAASESRSEDLLDAADAQFSAGQFADSARTAHAAVNEAVRTLQVRTGMLARDAAFPGASQQSLEALGVHPYKAYDYRLLSETAAQAQVSQADAQSAAYAARLLVAELGRTERQLYATVGQRTLAFLIDLGILLGIVLPILFAVTLTYPSDSSALLSYSPIFLGTLMWALSSSLVYFTALEWLFGRTVGKYVMHITVVSKMQTRASFMQVFARNVIRFLETMTLYVSAFVLIAVTRRAQRAGDILSGTVVIRTAPPQAQRATPPQTVAVQYSAPAPAAAAPGTAGAPQTPQ